MVSTVVISYASTGPFLVRVVKKYFKQYFQKIGENKSSTQSISHLKKLLILEGELEVAERGFVCGVAATRAEQECTDHRF